MQTHIAMSDKLVIRTHRTHHRTTIDYGITTKVQDPSKTIPTMAKGPAMAGGANARMAALTKGPASRLLGRRHPPLPVKTAGTDEEERRVYRSWESESGIAMKG